MRTLIVYYSRSGTTRRLAAALAGALEAELAEIRCERYGQGMFRYLRDGYESVRGYLPPIELPQQAPKTYDLVLIGTPIWTSHPALPIRAYLASAPELPGRVGLFLTYGDHSPPDRAFEEMQALLPGPAEVRLALKSTEIDDDSFTKAVDAFAETLSRPRVVSERPPEAS